MKYFVDDYVIFDLETTGLEKDKDKIIEIGALKYHNNELIDEFSYLINPECELPEVIINITGITNEDLKDKETIDKILPKFIEFIGDLPLIAHNKDFDLGFIYENIKKLNLTRINNYSIDTLYLARKYFPNLYNHKLETIKKYFNVKQVSHRATGDCFTTNVLYQECKKKELIKD